VYLILLGAPGAGKGTQADILSEEMNLAHIASGDLFRQALERKTELGLLAQSYMEKGELVPDEVTIRMVLERIAHDDCASGCIFDGFPRTLDQARALDEALAAQGKAVDKAMYIEVPEEELLRRLSGRWLCRSCQTPYHMVTSPPQAAGKCDKCGGELYQRPDDEEETVRERLKVFFAQTAPLLDYYERGNRLVKVNGGLGIEEVAKKVIGVLEEAS
jgi:adenylate kinase